MSELFQLYENAALLAANGSADSGWLDVHAYKEYVITKTSTGGTYALEIDLSNDGASVDEVQTVTLTNNTPLVVPSASRWARFRVRETGGSAAFSAHHTSVEGRADN